MGQQQLILIVLGVIIVGVAITVGMYMFSAYEASSNCDAIMDDVTGIEQDIATYSLRPVMMGGGGGSVLNYNLSSTGPWGTDNPNATYVVIKTPWIVIIEGLSKSVDGAYVIAATDATGQIIITPESGGF
jgi:hypothetical protein